MRDEGVSTVVGALLVLVVMAMSIVYVDAYYVPSQGTSLEVQAREAAQTGLASGRATLLSDPTGGARTFDVPLRAQPAAPPLLSGIVLAPVVAQGTLSFEASRTMLSISHVTNGTATAGDPMRVNLSSGLVRVYDLGNATVGAPVGTLLLAEGAAYLPSATYRLEGGALFVSRTNTSGNLQPPDLAISAVGNETGFSWRIPILVGSAAQVSGGNAAQVALACGPLIAVGGNQRVWNVTVTVQTDALGGWTAALKSVVGSRGNVTSIPGASPDTGTVTAFIPSPRAGVPSVDLDLSLLRQQATLAVRSVG